MLDAIRGNAPGPRGTFGINAPTPPAVHHYGNVVVQVQGPTNPQEIIRAAEDARLRGGVNGGKPYGWFPSRGF